MMHVSTEVLATVSVLLGYCLIKLAEGRLHRSNYKFLIKEGAEELVPKLMRAYYNTTNLLLIIALIEKFSKEEKVESNLQIIGVALLFIAVILRAWAINSLGRYWSMRCLFLPGFPRIQDGPFRFLKHPEYVSRIIEGAGLCLFLGAFFSFLPFVIINLFIMFKITRIEGRQLSEISTVLRRPQILKKF
ncbi:MAG: hypothetical protein HQK54_04220 [Oligoflexales bacterium]|nr:hypothetical protein [Oligoflexales bacterium]